MLDERAPEHALTSGTVPQPTVHSSSQMLDERKQHQQHAQPFHKPVDAADAPSWAMDRHDSSVLSNDATEQLRTERERVLGMGRSLAPVNHRKKRTMTPTTEESTHRDAGDSTQRASKRLRPSLSNSSSMSDEKA
jgi:hypothetical protein